MPKYRIQQALKHDGKSYADGDSIKLSETEAQALIDVGALGESQAEASKSEASKPEDINDLQSSIRDAVGLLDADNEILWTGSGKAKVESIEAVLGYAVTASERDTAMAEA